MPRKPTTRNAGSGASKAPAKARPVASTAVRKSSVPPRTQMPRQITHEQIAVRAYEIHISGCGGSEFDNWCRAERELRTELDRLTQ